MANDPTCASRAVPPSETIAWFLGDLIADDQWRDFDIGSVNSPKLDAIRLALHQIGGRDAWVRFVEEARKELPRLLAVPTGDLLRSARDKGPSLSEIWVIHRPALTVYVKGQLLEPVIPLGVFAHFKAAADIRNSIDYALYATEITLCHLGTRLQHTVARYFLPMPH